MSESYKRPCPVCGIEFTILDGGVVRVHGPRHKRCAGSGKHPHTRTVREAMADFLVQLPKFARCSRCAQLVRVAASGRFRTHKPLGQRCPGSGKNAPRVPRKQPESVE